MSIPKKQHRKIAAVLARLGAEDVAWADADHDRQVTMSRAMIANAAAAEPDACAMSRACVSQFPDVIHAWFWESAAYLLERVPDKPGHYVLLRFIPDRSTRAEIRQFDHTAHFHAGEYRLKAPRGSNTREAICERSRRRPGRHKPRGGPIRREPKLALRHNW